MKKEKLFKIGVVNKSTVDVVKDTMTFYTSDTELWLGFELAEVEYSYDNAEILLLNEDDRSFVVRPITQDQDGYWYEIEADITAHYGLWKGQLQLSKDGEVYTSKPFNFRIENDLSNDRPPQLVDVNNWTRLKQSANELIVDMRQAITEADKSESLRVKAEQERATAESDRKSAEATRVANEEARNMTSVEEFIKLQNAIGGRNLTRGNTDIIRTAASGDNRAVMLVNFGVRNFKANTDYTISIDLKVQAGVKAFNYNYLWTSTPDILGNVNIGAIDVIDDGEWRRYSKTFNFASDRYGEVRLGLDSRQADVNSNIPIEFAKWKLEEGSPATPYTKAPEDYTSVSKDDYYNHIDLVNDAKNNQFNQLKKAVIALGGTI